MKKNILILLLDGCRAQSLGCYGYTVRDTSPNVDALAERGLVAQKNYATSFCTMPSIVSMMTGLYPCVHKATATWGYYDGAFPFLTDILRANGYQTFGVSNNIAAMSPEWGFVRGYDRYYRVGKEENWFKASKEEQRGVRKAKLKTRIQRSLFEMFKKRAPELSDEVRRRASITHFESHDMGGNKAVESFELALKERDKEKPFFGYVNLPDTHAPFTTINPFAKTWGKLDYSDNLLKLFFNSSEFYEDGLDLTQEDIAVLQASYDTCVRYVDHLVGRIVQILHDSKLFENTVLLLLGDHGGMTYEKKQLYGGASFTYEPEIRVPFIIVDHGLGRQTDRLTSVVDVFPTIHDLAGIEMLSDSLCHGKSVFQSNAGHSEVVIDYPAYPDWLSRTVVKWPETLIRYGKTNRTMVTAAGEKIIWVNNGQHERYDLGQDPLENHNLFSGREEDFVLIKKMQDKYQQLLGSKGAYLEYYPHNDIGEESLLLPPLQVVNPEFNPESIRLIER